MEVLKRKSTLVAALTLIIGVGLGLGIGTWTTRSDAASSSKSEKVEQREEARRPSISRSGEWDPFREMERMQEEIDRAIRRATDSFRLGREPEPFSRDVSYSSSLDVRDREDHFEVRAYLPDAETKDVKVTTEGDQTLRVKVSHRKEQKREKDDTESVWRELGQYEQVVTLPEPVNSQEMKVDTRDHELVITIPKAKAS
jgi:HSP20 family molecular chaperone IbpA